MDFRNLDEIFFSVTDVNLMKLISLCTHEYLFSLCDSLCVMTTCWDYANTGEERLSTGKVNRARATLIEHEQL